MNKEWSEKNIKGLIKMRNKHWVIAKNIKEYNLIPNYKLENMIYSAEMSVAR